MTEINKNESIMITTDSVCDLPEEMIKELSIKVCPYYVRTGKGKFLDGCELDPDELLDRMEKKEDVVSSEAPSVSDYEAFFRECSKAGGKILHISMGKKVGSGYAHALEASKKISGVSVIDSGQISSGLGLVVIKAARLAGEGYDGKQLKNAVKEYAASVSSSFVIRELEFMNRSGRLSNRTKKICERLLLHPVLSMKNSGIKVTNVIVGRWTKVSGAYIRKQLRKQDEIDQETLFITHAGVTEDELDDITKEVRKKAAFRHIHYVKASPAISSNCGRGCFGLLFARREREKGRLEFKRLITRKVNYLILVAFVMAMSAILFLNGRLYYNMTGEQADAIGRAQMESVSGKLNQTLYEAEILTRKAAGEMEQILSAGLRENEVDEFISRWNENSGNEDCINVYVAGEDWFNIPGVNEKENFSPIERVWYQGARKKGAGNIYFTAPYLDYVTGKMCFTVSELLSDGETVVAMDFNLISLQEGVSEAAMAGGDALIVSESGQIVGYREEEAVGSELAAALPQYTSVFQRIRSSGEDNLYFKTKIGGTDSTVFYNRTANEWYLLSIVSNTALYRENMSGILANSIMNLCLVLGMISLFIVSARYRRSIERSLRNREASAKEAVKAMHSSMEDMINRSDYQMLLSSEDPDEYMRHLRESSLRLKAVVNGLSDGNKENSAAGSPGERQKKYDKDRSGVSDKTNRYVSAGIIGLLALTMVLCMVISTKIMANWGNTRMERETDIYAGEMNSWTTEQKSVLDMFVSYISANPEILDEYESCVAWLDDITSQYEDISVSYMTNPRAEHTVIMNNGWIPEEGWKVEERQWYIDSMESEREDGFSISAPYYDDQVGAYCVTFSKRVYDKKGNFLGIFGIDFFLDKLTQILDNSYTDEGYAFLADADGQIINHPNEAYQMTEKKEVSLEETGYLKAVFSEDTVLIRDYDGMWRAFHSTTDEKSGFSIICAKNWNVIYGSLVEYDVIFLLIFGMGIAVAVILLRMMLEWQRRATEVLQESVDAATRAGRAKSRFLAQMSHEIRTPINAVLGMNEMILRESDSPAIHHYSDNIRSAGRTLLTLINSILDFSKIEDGKMEIVHANYDVVTMIADLENMVKERAEKKKLFLKLEIDEKLPRTLFGDDVRIRQIITNLLTNAVKYTQKGSVTLRMRAGEKKGDSMILHVEVEDTGMGIRQEDREALFQSFQRLDIEKNRSIEGTGLGISIVQKLLTMMGSTLQLDSTYGEGSNFYFDLKQQVVDDEQIGNYKEMQKISKVHGRETKYVYAPQAKILVVDDNSMNLEVAKGLLKRSEIKVETASGGMEAIEMITNNDYDIVFLDHMMPDLDGIQTLKRLREMNALSDMVPVIMMTANAIAGAREEYLNAGFDDYLSKPIEVAGMERILEQYIPREKLGFKTVENAPVKETEKTPPEPAKKEETEGESQKKDAATDDPALGEQSGQQMPLIDQNTGMEYCMNDKEFYHKMLETYIAESADKRKALEEYLKSGDIRLYTVQIHAIKSTSKTIGALRFADQAYELELAGKEGRMDDIKAGHDAVMKGYEDVLGEARSILETC